MTMLGRLESLSGRFQMLSVTRFSLDEGNNVLLRLSQASGSEYLSFVHRSSRWK